MASCAEELAEQAKGRKTVFLSPKIVLPLRKGNPKALAEAEANKLRDEIRRFRALTGHASLEAFYSKYCFIEKLDRESAVS